jgi:predicted nucleic acid-binding Zn ribbon protein
MPTYEYKCSEKPEHRFTEKREMSEEVSRSGCAEKGCNGKLLRIFGTPPITFNGTGFNAKRG